MIESADFVFGTTFTGGAYEARGAFVSLGAIAAEIPTGARICDACAILTKLIVLTV